MKKMYALILLIALFSCEPNAEHTKTNKTYNMGNIRIVEIDGCEYVLSDVYGGDDICHKGNCKYCIERGQNNGK